MAPINSPFYSVKYLPIVEWLAIALLTLLAMSGCATMSQRPPETVSYDPGTAAALAAIADNNPDLTAFKGIGTYRIDGNAGRLSGRIAWAAQLPDRLRIAVLDVTGKPITVMATDGRRLYLDLRSEQRFYKKGAAGASLEKMIGIDIGVGDVIAVLAGRIPLTSHHSGRLAAETPRDRFHIDLKNRRGDTVQEIHGRRADDTQIAEKFTVFDPGQGMRYRVDTQASYENGGSVFFKTIAFRNRANRFRLEVDRIWANVAIDDRLFRLTEKN